MIFRGVWIVLGILWAISGVAAIWQGRQDAAGSVALCAVALVVGAFILGRRSHGAKARAAARAKARATARASSTAGADASARVLLVNNVGQGGEDVRRVPAWQDGGRDRMETVALEALRAGELDAGDDVDALLLEDQPADAQPLDLRGF